MPQPPSAPPADARCDRCGQSYPAGTAHVCATENTTAPASAPSSQSARDVNFGSAPTVKGVGLGVDPAALGASGSPGPVFSPEADPLLGTVINERFKILRCVGKGGMGVVYKARHLTLDTHVAIKVLLHQRSRDDQERFVQEARLASKVRHPNLVYLSDSSVLPDGRLYLVMEFLQGRLLSGELTKGPLELTRALKVAIQITRGLQAVHDKGIVHRDMKPENVFLLEQDGTADFVKIVDFGIAKATAAAAKTDEPSEPLNLAELEKALAAEEAGRTQAFKKTETRAGQTIGTPPYMSPEQVQSLPVDPRTDQYALCGAARRRARGNCSAPWSAARATGQGGAERYGRAGAFC